MCSQTDDPSMHDQPRPDVSEPLTAEGLMEIVSDSLAATTEGTDWAEAPEPSDEPGSPYVKRLTNEMIARGALDAARPSGEVLLGFVDSDPNRPKDAARPSGEVDVETVLNAAAAVAYAINRLPPSGSRMTQAAERRAMEALALLDVALDAARDRPGLPCHCGKPWADHDVHYPDAAAQQREGAGPRWTVGVDEFGEEHIDDAAQQREGAGE